MYDIQNELSIITENGPEKEKYRYLYRSVRPDGTNNTTDQRKT